MPELMEPFVYGVESAGKLCAVCVGYVTKEPNAIKQFFTRRAIIIGGAVVAKNCAKEDIVILLNCIRRDLGPKTIYIETRNFNEYSVWKEAFEDAGFTYKPHLNFHVDPSLNNLSDNRKRQLKKSDATTELAVSESEIQEWYQVLAELYRTKVKTPLWPIEFFLEAYRRNIAKFLLVKHEGRIIGGSMVVSDQRTVYEWFECGLNAECKDEYPSVMATYAGIQLAHQTGCKRYDMMGAGEPGVPYGVRDFKAEFGGQLVEHGRFLCVTKPLLYKIGTIAVKILKHK
jgi:predicted N-acyltransferase